MITIADREMTKEFMSTKFGMRPSGDFRGVMFIPDSLVTERASMDHVGVAYAWDNFVGKTCCISIVVQKPECLTRPVIREAFRFPFEDCGCVAIYALVDSANHASIGMCQRVGFDFVHRTPGAGKVADLILFEMLRDKCRWLKRTH